MIKNIIFDLGRVIITHKRTVMEDILAVMFPDAKPKAILLYEQYKEKLQTGKINSKEFIHVLKQSIKNKFSQKALMDLWDKEYKNRANIDYEILNLIKKLNKNYKLYLLTDTLDIHADYHKQKNIYSHFKRVFKSFEEGISKPDKKAFLNLLSKIKARANDCIFIDDLEKNIEAAENVGMKGILYKNINLLKKELTKFRVKF